MPRSLAPRATSATAMTALIALTSSLLLTGATPVHAADGWQPPPPIQYDPYGTDQDGLLLEAEYARHPRWGDLSYKVNGTSLVKGYNALSDFVPAGSTYPLTVTVALRDPDPNDGESYSWEFTFTDEPVREEAPNQLEVELGECDPGTGRTPVTAYVTNTAEPDGTDGRLLPLVLVSQDHAVEQTAGYSESAYTVLDGETRAMPIRKADGGLRPGTWYIRAWVEEDGNNDILPVQTVFIPACGEEEVPPGDPGITEIPKPATPRGSLTGLRHRSGVVARMVNRRVEHTTRFRIRLDRPGPGGVSRTTVQVPADHTTRRALKAPRGTRAALHVRQGRTWRLLDTHRIGPT